MIASISKELYPVSIPHYEGEIKMLPFELSDLANIPEKFKKLVENLISFLPIKQGIAFLTIDGKTIQQGSTHRRGGKHIDGNYIFAGNSGWGGDNGGNGGGNGWKVGENGFKLSLPQHKISYENPNGGMIIASDFVGCMGWNGVFEGKAGIGGDCTHLDIKQESGFLLKPNVAYYGNSQFVHESLPIEKNIHRNLVRITLPLEYPPLMLLTHNFGKRGCN